MILVDTSVWIDHLRSSDKALADLLDRGQILAHPFVIAEIALGNLKERDLIIGALQQLPQAVTATDGELMAFIAAQRLFGLGIGYVDVHLLASARLMEARIWTRDKRFRVVGARLGLTADLT